MKAVILAAGAGGRLRGVSGDRPKCLVRVGETTLLERQIRSLQAQGLDDITVVAGYKADDVRRACGGAASIVRNLRHATTDSLYSLWLTRASLASGFLVMNCDVLFHPQLLADLVSARYEDAALVSTRGRSGAYSGEEMKVRIRRGLIMAIDKGLDDSESDGENIGIAKFGACGATVLIDQMNRLVATSHVRDWLPCAFHEFCRVRPLHAVDSRGYPWIEIDFPDDYWQACSDVLPAIEDTSPCMNASTTFANARSHSAPTRTTSIRARSTRKR